MRRSKKPIVIASRQSPLARIQAEMVGNGLARLNPGIQVQYVWVESQGDKIATGPLAEAGGKGLFTKAVEKVVLRKEADIAVHSMKDLPADELTPGLQIAAVPRRADVRDVLIGQAGAIAIDELPNGAKVGTSSPRRAAQLKRLRPDLVVAPIRGNVDTRLSKLSPDTNPADAFDATLLALAGLSRLGKRALIEPAISLQQVLPAACQGALGIQCRRDDHVSLTRLLPLNDPATSTAIHHERALVAGLGADCYSPIAVLAEPVDPEKSKATRNADSHWFRLRARVLSPNGSKLIEADEQCKTPDLRRLVKRLVKQMTEQGAGELLQNAHSH